MPGAASPWAELEGDWSGGRHGWGQEVVGQVSETGARADGVEAGGTCWELNGEIWR